MISFNIFIFLVRRLISRSIMYRLEDNFECDGVTIYPVHMNELMTLTVLFILVCALVNDNSHQ